MEHALDRLFATVAARKTAGEADKSYTAQLLSKGMTHVAKKFGEEAVETILAAAGGDKTEIAKESADMLYHLTVLWAAAGVTPDDVYAVLKAREAQSGLEEKAARKK